MADDDKKTVSVSEALQSSGAPTNKEHKATLAKVKFRLLEFEDVLFHHNSAVMMPDCPAGQSSKDGGGGSDAQTKVCGVKAIALVFKELEFNDNQRLIIAGHTDTSGDDELNFKLSEQRARNVLYLLTGERDEWAKLSYERHKVEDYQQILTHLAVTRKWNFCNPGKIDDKWGPKTSSALGRLVLTYNSEYAAKHVDATRLPGDLSAQVEKDAKHRCPVVFWKAVYDLYIDDLLKIMKSAPEQLDALREERLKFIADDPKLVKEGDKRYVGCGESFPLDAVGKDGYRSQENRRVEILFFDAADAPVIDCPAQRKKKHVKTECPLWHDYHLPVHVDPADLNAVMYHLSFRYFDRIQNAMKDVPDGLEIKAYEKLKSKPAPAEVPTEVEWKKGIYSVKVKFKTPLNDPDREGLHFEFKKPDRMQGFWVYTKAKDADSEILFVKPVEILGMSLADRQKYYDLPWHWSSQSYWTRYDGKMDTGDRWETVIKKHKPFGGTQTSSSKYLIFCLDDIVLVDATGKQVLKDRKFEVRLDTQFNRYNPSVVNEADIDLNDDSRYSLLYVKDGNLTLFDPENADAPYFSNHKFNSNLIYKIPQDGHARAVAFCNKLYHVLDKRAEAWNDATTPFDPAKHVRGCRAAVISDANWLVSGQFNNASNLPVGHDHKYFADGTGNYELHYLHEAAVIPDTDGLKRRSFLIIYWSAVFIADRAHPIPAPNPADPKPYAGDGPGTVVTLASLPASHGNVVNMATKGMKNSKVRWEEKGYTIEPVSKPVKATDCDIQIVPYFLFEARQAFRGGSPKCVARVFDNADDVSSMGITRASLNWKEYEDREPDPVNKPGEDEYGVPATDRVDGSRRRALTVAHELGHAEGKDDEYHYQRKFDQYYPGMPYTIDKGSMMRYNRLARLRHLWYFVNWINDAAAATKPLNPLLGTTTFKLVYRIPSGSRQVNMPTRLDFNLADKYRKIYLPVRSGDVNTGTNQVLLALYKLGDDEGAYNLTIAGPTPPAPPRSFDAILVVYIKIVLRFTSYMDEAGTTHNWTNNEANDWLNALRSKIEDLNDHFYLRQSDQNTAHDFKNTYVEFRPIVWVNSTDTPTGQSHYEIQVVKDGRNTVSYTSGRRIEAGDQAEKLAVVRVMLGQNDGTTDAAIRRFFGVRDRNVRERLAFVETWFKQVMRDNALNMNFSLRGEYPYPP